MPEIMKKIKIYIKNIAVFAAAVLIAAVLCSCGAAGAATQETETVTQSETAAKTTDGETQSAESGAEDKNMREIKIIAGGKTFYAELYDNETAREFAKLLPLTVNMSELNANEKYYYLQNSLPADSSRPGTIHTGDLMLYGSDCIVLFYKDFSTSYSYTPLGRINDPAGLADALGGSSVQVTFEY